MAANESTASSVAIIGAGPAGCSLACFLATRGIDCVVYDDQKKPELLVGESLIPAAIPILQRLGIEAEVAAISSLKKGAALRFGDGSPRVDFAFQHLTAEIPDYAYNIPRPKFDSILRQRAQTLGARFIEHRAQVLACPGDGEHEIQLSDESLRVAGLCRATQPDLLIDATGRSRLFSRVLQIPADRGPRNDVAHFAHFKNFPSDSRLTGQVVISILESGWSWQIPLPGKTSVGVVLNRDAAASYGSTAAQRLETVIRQNAVLNKTGFKRVTDVKTYANYQLISQKGFGKGWVLLGDALGFVDPMLSPGVFMALESASLLDHLVFNQQHLSVSQRDSAMRKYYQEIRHWHDAWSSTIEYFYDGRLMQLGELRPSGDAAAGQSFIGKLTDRLISKLLSGLVSGAGTRSRINQAALRLICLPLSRNAETQAGYAIKNTVSATPALLREGDTACADSIREDIAV